MRSGAYPRSDLEELSGYVLNNDSPSCGLERVNVYGRRGGVTQSGQGLFARALVERWPLLPVEEEGRLSDPPLREHFIERVFAYWRLCALFRSPWTVGALVRFHTAHKLVLMAHSPEAYRQIGRLTAAAAATPRVELERRYSDAFLRALAIVATRRRHTNVLQHMLGYFKRRLDAGSKAEVVAAIEDYRQERVPLLLPLTLIRHHARVHRVEYLSAQLYLAPYPERLMERSR